MQVLVTGGTGFIGSHAAVALQQEGHDVRLLIRNPQKLDAVMAMHQRQFTDVVVGDVTDAAVVKEALQDCQAVVHTAAFVSTSKKDEERVFNTNVGGTKNVIGQGVELGLKQLVHVSSTTALYSPDLDLLTGEEPPAQSDSPYGRSKAACESYVRELQAEGAPVTLIYPAAVIGPHDPALSEPVDAVRIFVSKGGLRTSSGCQFVDVRDVARGCVNIIEDLDHGERIPMGGHYYSWGEFLKTLNELTGRYIPYAPVPGAMLRGIGRFCDFYSGMTGATLPLSLEGARYASRWVPTDDSKFKSVLGLEFTDHKQTMADTILSLHAQGHLQDRHVGKLLSASRKD